MRRSAQILRPACPLALRPTLPAVCWCDCVGRVFPFQNFFRVGVRRFSLALGAVLAIAVVAAAERPAAPSSWTARVWRADDGLPDNRVTGAVQTPDGSLWVATRGGLVRFNGSTFEGFDLTAVEGVIGNGVLAMFSDSRGNLWLGGYREAVLRVGIDSVQVFTAAGGLPAGQFTGFAEDGEGVLWFAFGGRICLLKGTRLQELELPEGVRAGNRAALIRDARGRAWCALNGRVGILRAGRFEQRLRLDSRDVLLAKARAGGLWACAGGQVLRIAEDGAATTSTNLPAGVRPLAMLEDGDGALWIGTLSHGLLRHDGRRVEEVGTSHGHVANVMEDREGNIWAGTFGGGLNRIRPRAIELIGTKSGLPFESVLSVGEDAEGRFWVVGDNGQIARGDGAVWNVVPAGGGAAACVAADRSGRIWVGTRGMGLREIDGGGGLVRTWWQEDGLPSNSIRSLLVANDGTLWVATNGPARLSSLSHGAIRTLPMPRTARNIRALIQDGSGVIWVGTSDGQVLKVAGDKLVSDPGFAGSGSTSVRCLHATPDGSLWVGYAERGIAVLKDGRYKRLTTVEGLVDNSIWQISSDHTGSLWLAGAHGLSRVALAEVTAVAQGRLPKFRPTVYGRVDGLPNLQPHYGNSPAVCQSRDGRILFSTSLGLLALQPENLRDNRVPPPVVLERVTLDDQVVALRASRFPLRTSVAPEVIDLGSTGGVLHVSPEHRRLTFAFAALSYSAPENVRYRYRLDGFDDRWTESDGEQLAHYGRLTAGHYQFRVVASNDAGVWNTSGATVGVVVRPFFWQTWWFRTALLGAFTAVVVIVVRWVSFQRLRARLRLAEQQAALLQERTRIARDIHDDLGGSLAHIKLLSEIAVQDPAATAGVDGHLRQITRTTRQMLKSLDETIWAINPRNDTLPHLISYVGQHAVEFLRAAGIACQVDLPDDPPDVQVASDVRHHVFLAVKEALTNVVRHSSARVVRLRATIEAGELRLVIEDDGCGFDAKPDDGLADGIRNMQQRMGSVGGSFRIESKAGKGTHLELAVRINVAA